MCLAIPGEILQIEEGEPLLRRGKVSFGGVVKEVSLALVPEAKEGHYVLVHAGMAIGTIDEAEAQKVFETLEEMAEALEEAGEP